MSIGTEGENLVFLISQPRAGSTLLQRMLAGHSEIFSSGEPWLLLPLVYMRHHKDDSTAVYRANWAQEALTAFLESLPSGTYEQGVRQMVRSIYNEALQDTPQTIFLDKTPRYYHIIPQLAAIFPQAKFILLFRNPLAVLTSLVHTWVQESWFNLAEHRYDLLDAPRLLLEGQTLLGERAFPVAYETVVAEPGQVMGDLCRFLSIAEQPGLVNYDAHAPSEKWLFGDPESVYQHKRPEPEVANRWRERLTYPQTWRVVHDYLLYLQPDMLSRLGYDYDALHEIVLSHRPPLVQRSLTFSLSWLLGKSRYERTSPEFHLLNTARYLQRLLASGDAPPH